MDNNVEWMINPRNGKYIGHAVVRGMHLYASGRNLQHLSRNMKQQAWKYKLPNILVRLPLKPSQEIDLSHATQMFYAKSVEKVDPRFMDLYEAKRMAKKEQKNKPELHKEKLCDDKPVENVQPVVQCDGNPKYISKIVNGELIVYKVIEAVRYPLMDVCLTETKNDMVVA